jgi:hypothetical protein
MTRDEARRLPAGDEAEPDEPIFIPVPLRRFARAIRDHLEGVLGHFWWSTTNAQLEGPNHKIKLAAHRAFGSHSVEVLMVLVYHSCGGIDLMTGPGISSGGPVIGRQQTAIVGPGRGILAMWRRLTRSGW